MVINLLHGKLRKKDRGLELLERKFPAKLIDLAAVRNLRHQKFQELFCPARLLAPSFFLDRT
ncbi:hypothetical protein C7Y66_19300 [Chroococcidiopsis sp. CCALA 051]|nr:hypothetical protein C7Y66_19300 [Chroococcidiopsis sp. CCALA 051]